MDNILPIAIIVLCVASEFFFSGSEIAMVSADRLKMRKLAEKGSRGGKQVERFMERPEWMLGTTLVGTNLSVVTSTVLATLLMRNAFGEIGELYTLIVMSPLLLIFGEIIPKSIFQQRADAIAPRVALPLRFASVVVHPILTVVTGIANGILRIVGVRGDGPVSPFITREALDGILRKREPGSDLKPAERTMIRRIFNFSETTVEEVMIPLIDVVAVSKDVPPSEALEMMSRKAFSRLPVYRERVDDIIGILTNFDLLAAQDDLPSVQSLIRTVPYVPETKRIDDLLLRFQMEGSHMAIAVDEYGGVVGIVTVEDILEEIVGEIEDEHDEVRQLYRIDGENRYIINARMEIDSINEVLPFELPEGDFETLGGFILGRFGRIPAVGDTLKFENLVLIVTKADRRSVVEVRVEVR